MKRPVDYERHRRGDNRRFHVRQHTRDPLTIRFEVYGAGFVHICDCLNSATARMIAASLEEAADRMEDSDE